MNKTIMIVDDDREILMLLTFVLSRRGYTVDTAQSGAIALDKLASKTPDLFILDIMMPDMNGFELCRTIRSRNETAQTPIIIFTADLNPLNKEKGLAVGANDFLQKPIRNSDLLVRVANAFERTGSIGGLESGLVGC